MKRFLPSEFGSNTPDPRVSAIVPIFAAKTGAVEYLKSKESEITWSSLIPGGFFDWVRFNPTSSLALISRIAS